MEGLPFQAFWIKDCLLGLSETCLGQHVEGKFNLGTLP